MLLCKPRLLPKRQRLPLSALIIDRNHILLSVELSVPGLCEPARTVVACCGAGHCASCLRPASLGQLWLGG